MANTLIQLKRSSVPGNTPANNSIQPGELAINLADRKLYSKDTANVVFDITMSGPQGAQGAQGAQGVDGDRYQTTSNTSYTIQSGGNSGTIIVETGLSYSAGQSIKIAYDISNIQLADVTTYYSANGELNFNTTSNTGSGTYSAWTVNLAGATGALGPQGPQGAQGNAGSLGPTGPQGNQGSTGPQGSQGSTGSTGAQGPQGNTGPQGSQGAQGITGATGSQGPQGAQGETGSQGSTGAQGPQGNTGSQGSTGAQGPQGNTGSAGPTGPQGSQGSTGPQGAQGNQGSTGSQGPQGNTGSQGSTGAQGPQGDTGSQGAQGSTGSQGPQGVTGSTGAQGSQGAQGTTGAQGPQGNTGAQGAQGNQGATGSTGAQGPQGAQGNTGSQGPQGITGSVGPTGPQGAQGAQGLTGPVAGSNNQIIYKDSANVATGSSGLIYDGVSLKVNGNLESVYSNGDEGGEIFLQKPQTNTALASGVTIDVFQNKLRFFENGGTNRGAFIELTSASTGVGSNILAGGPQGPQGSTGPQGTTGAQGPQGNQGSAGAQGPQGNTGPQGAQGTQGNTGSQGPQGNQGSAGPQGAQGAQGISGAQGSQGAQGITGPQGSQGNTGSVGPTGPQGNQGATGPQGSQGAQGSQGSAGAQGSQGAQGTAGSQGAQGSQGALQPWSRKTTTYTAVNGDRLIADTSAGSFTITLPATPSTGDYIQITDGNDFSGNNLTVARNGSTIDGNADDVLLDIKGVTFEFIYDGSTWEVTGTTGAAGQQGAQGVAGTTGPQGPQGAAGSGGGSLGPWEIKTSNYTAVDGDRILATSTSGAFTITLPATPSAGHSIIIADGNDFSTNNVTVARNGSTIEGLAEDLVLDVQGIQADFVYDGTTWETFTTTGIGSTQFATLNGIENLSNKTLTNPSVNGAIIEEIFTITDGPAFEIDPTNGTIQFITLGASRTPKGTNFINGESVTLMIDDGSAFTITWTDTTFGASGVVWVGGSAPTLDTTKLTVVELWRANNQVYGALVGAA